MDEFNKSLSKEKEDNASMYNNYASDSETLTADEVPDLEDVKDSSATETADEQPCYQEDNVESNKTTKIQP